MEKIEQYASDFIEKSFNSSTDRSDMQHEGGGLKVKAGGNDANSKK